MKPSVGRTVHWRAEEDVCYAAIVTGVDTGPWVNQDTGETTVRETACLCIMPPMRESFTRVAMEGDSYGTWHWPERVDD